MRATVWVDAWQMQCCGEPFAIGEEVRWLLSDQYDSDWLHNILGTARRIDYSQEHHGPSDGPITQARVLGIQSVHCRYGDAPPGAVRFPEPASGEVQDVPSADGWDPESPALHFVGYLVELDLFDPR